MLLLSLSHFGLTVLLSRVWRSHVQGKAQKPGWSEAVLAWPDKQMSCLICNSRFTYGSQGPFSFLHFSSALFHFNTNRDVLILRQKYLRVLSLSTESHGLTGISRTQNIPACSSVIRKPGQKFSNEEIVFFSWTPWAPPHLPEVVYHVTQKGDWNSLCKWPWFNLKRGIVWCTFCYIEHPQVILTIGIQ